LLRVAQILRAYLILGPLRRAILRHAQRFSKNQPLRQDTYPAFPSLRVDDTVDRINEAGHAHIGHLPEEWVTAILAYCDQHKLIRYWNPHEDCNAVDRLARNATILNIVGKYLGAEPRLWLTQLRWSFAPADDPRRHSRHQEPVQYDSHAFHYDMLDVKSLTLFVYLTDVDADSGPHVIIEGTHKSKRLREIGNIVLDNATVQKKYGNRIKPIIGKRGTAFLEDTGAFHRAADGTKTRLLLSIDYVLNRKQPPERPILKDA
jgi:hypothetical protein